LPAEQSSPVPIEFVRNAERYFTALASQANPEESLGGSLLYAGALSDDTRALAAAANVAGAATLVVAEDTAAQKQAARDGIADFLVTSLDEALRILKNEIRKRATVAVCVAAAPTELEREMLERGVVPDLVSAGAARVFPAARAIKTCPVHDPAIRIEWRVSTAPALWMPKLDEIARACLPVDNAAAHRWLRLAPRYCGRAAMSLRVLRCASKIAEEFSARVAAGIADGSIGVPVEVHTTTD